MARVCSSPYTTNEATPRATPGMIYDGLDSLGLPAQFRYVKFDGLASLVAGDVVEFNNVAMTSVTDDKTGGTPASLGRCPAGIACYAVTEDNYGYILVRGYHATCQGDGSVGVGEAVMSHATTDGAADTATGAGRQIGVALADDSGSPVVFAGYFNFL